MANFSVEWLSKSFHEGTTLQDEVAVRHSKARSEMAKFTKESRSPDATSPHNTCGSTSGSESEVGDDSEGEATQQRRMRTKFTSEQISSLEDTFSKHKYLGAIQRRKIARNLNLSEAQVKTWFQNRRMKLKREVPDLLPAVQPVPAARLFQHPALSGQLPAPSGQLPAPSGQLPAPSGQLPAPSGQLPAPSGQLPAPSGQLPAPSGQLPAPSTQLPARSGFHPQQQPLHSRTAVPAPLHRHRPHPRHAIMPPRFC